MAIIIFLVIIMVIIIIIVIIITIMVIIVIIMMMVTLFRYCQNMESAREAVAEVGENNPVLLACQKVFVIIVNIIVIIIVNITFFITFLINILQNLFPPGSWSPSSLSLSSSTVIIIKITDMFPPGSWSPASSVVLSPQTCATPHQVISPKLNVNFNADVYCLRYQLLLKDLSSSSTNALTGR